MRARPVIEFRFEHVFDGVADDYWWAFFSEECTREQYQAIGVRELEIVEQTDDGVEATRIIRVAPARDLPGFIRKLTGASLSYTETSRLDRRTGIATTEVTPSTLASRVTVRGTHEVTPLPKGRLERVFSGIIDVQVPLAGGRIEAAVLADMEASYARSAGITQAWMKRRIG